MSLIRYAVFAVLLRLLPMLIRRFDTPVTLHDFSLTCHYAAAIVACCFAVAYHAAGRRFITPRRLATPFI